VADDVEQEAWTTAFEKLHRLRDPGALAAWLRQIARRLALRERRRSRRWRGSTEEPRERESSIETDPRWASSDVRAALQRLSDDHREILELRYLRELEYEEIVRELGCPIGTVRSRLHYARLALRRVMEGSDHVD
ncbi:MAG: sigma-70 family RNA polymerase sigma factor, partial [Planctomycetes bacterium]|nr:sigma-70 family RNA polymerase sigma factor [Planctomycetota bacterium]